MSDYYDRAGQPIALLEWARLLEDKEYRSVALDEVRGMRVSTVWLGLNQNRGPGPPLIFETMLFGWGEDGNWRWRYATEDEAVSAHRRIAERMQRIAERLGLPPDDRA